MKWNELSDQHCSIARTLAVVGDRWTLMVLRDLFLGATRFESIRQNLGISRTILTDRLNLLQREGVISRQVYQQKPLRHKYKLTRKGIDLFPVMMSLAQWGDTYYADESGPPVVHRHQKCGKHFHGVLTCSECGEPISPFETAPSVSLRETGGTRHAPG